MSKSRITNVSVQSEYPAESSRPHESHFVFSYTITIRNLGDVPAQLVERHWIISDGEDEIREVRGAGVVGEQPWLQPGSGFQYSSGAVLKAPVGTMHGSYRMRTADGRHFDADIPRFVLSVPRTLH